MADVLTPEQMARRVAAELQDGQYVNLGFGMPLLVGNCLPPGRDVIIHTENGMLGVGPVATPGAEDPDLVNAGKQHVTERPGAAYFAQSDSFAMIRGGHIDVSILGAYQVAENGDLANWAVPGERIPRVGGAMDLAAGAKQVIAVMTHVTKQGDPKLLRRCTLPLTGLGCVDLVVTDIAVVAVTPEGFVLREVAPGWTPEEVQARTGAPLRISPDLREIPPEHKIEREEHEHAACSLPPEAQAIISGVRPLEETAPRAPALVAGGADSPGPGATTAPATRGTPGPNGRVLRGIDVHTHLPPRGGRAANPRAEQMERYFRSPTLGMGVEEMVELYRKLEMVAITFHIDSETTSDQPYDGNDYIAEMAARYPDVLIGWASVDPWKGNAAVRELERSVTQLGLRGLKLMPITQHFFPNEERFYPLYAKAQELGIPVLFHTGHTGIGAGQPGGTGLKLKYSRPIPYLDDVAADFPELTIIGAHPSWPWQEEMLSVALHKANVYIDLSGWSPKYFSPSLIQYANTLLQNKVLFGSDFPVINPERWLKDFEEAPFRDEVRPKIMTENARRVLKLQI